ncbi:MFS transporter [Rhodococcus sp. G-MC3]|uniref:MFS transporter n=1 Tax=Rhodococcus sp. G-MC3 TaxID=3046209 RepID=UPI0024B99228|nr:MFS transporter [Rhodococcus sp. G-MC3]MDJ0396404.1 MFS transporter [Rhodococcus sp. G-MC3]
MTTHPRLPLPAYISVAVLAFIAVSADGYDLAIFGAAIPDLLAYPTWDLTPARVGVIASTAIIGMCIGSITAGLLADRYGARRLFLACVTWFSVAMILCAAAPTAELLGVARFVAGIGLGGLGPAAIALTMSVAPEHRRNFINGVMLTGLPIGSIVAALSALAFLEGGGWRAVFLIGGVIPLFTVVPLGVMKLRQWAPDGAQSASASTTPSTRASLRALVAGGGARALVAFIVVTACCQLLSYGLLTWLPQIMKSSGYSLGSSLAFLIIFSIGAMAGSTTGSWIADKVGGRAVVIIGFAIGAAAIFGLSVQLPQPLLYAALFFAGAGSVGVQPVVYGFAATYFPAEARGSALGLIAGLGRIGGIFGPILGGLLAGLPALTNFSVFATIALLASLLSWAVLTGTPDRVSRPVHSDNVAAEL